jgi:hypothetical protein
MSAETDEKEGKAINIKACDAPETLHDQLERYIARRREKDGVKLTKPRAVIEIINSALAHEYPLSQPAKQ